MRAWCGIVWLATIASAAQLTAADGSPDACVLCHPAQARAFANSAMAQALRPAQDSAVLSSHPKLTAQIDGYSYEIVHGDGGPLLTVSDRTGSLQAPIEWVFGQGGVGQTFVFRIDNGWYESRVSYFPDPVGLVLTIGAQNLTPHNLQEAAGRRSSPADMRPCFDCHATNVPKSLAGDLSSMIPGVQCERCHGPTESHLEAVRGGKAGTVPRRLGALTTEEQSDFCGQCHRTWADIAAQGPRGILNIRFQPYRLANSKCYDAEDRRIRCTACHDPHRATETATEAYDARCVSCHVQSAKGTKAASRICPTGKRDCVTCHMPRLDLPGAHRSFTDHWIRIVKAGAPFPG